MPEYHPAERAKEVAFCQGEPAQDSGRVSGPEMPDKDPAGGQAGEISKEETPCGDRPLVRKGWERPGFYLEAWKGAGLVNGSSLGDKGDLCPSSPACVFGWVTLSL